MTYDVVKNRTIAVLDTTKNLSELTGEQQTKLHDIYQDTKHLVRKSEIDLVLITEIDLYNWFYENTEGNVICYFMTKNKGNMMVHFDSEEDAVAFKLRW